MKATVTGATGFLGAQVTRLLSERGHDVRVAYRNPDRLDALAGVEFRRTKADVLDFRAMRRADHLKKLDQPTSSPGRRRAPVSLAFSPREPCRVSIERAW